MAEGVPQVTKAFGLERQSSGLRVWLDGAYADHVRGEVEVRIQCRSAIRVRPERLEHLRRWAHGHVDIHQGATAVPGPRDQSQPVSSLVRSRGNDPAG